MFYNILDIAIGRGESSGSTHRFRVGHGQFHGLAYLEGDLIAVDGYIRIGRYAAGTAFLIKCQTQSRGGIGLHIHSIAITRTCTPAILRIFIKDGDRAVGALGQAGIGKEALRCCIVGTTQCRTGIGTTDIDGIRPGHSGSAFNDAHKDMAVQAVSAVTVGRAVGSGTLGAGNQDHLLAVYRFGIGNGRKLGVGIDLDARTLGVTPGFLGHIIIHIGKVSGAVAVEETQRSLANFYDGRLGTPGIIALHPLPAFVFIVVNEAHSL